MARSVFIYQCWSGEDMAGSDTWYATAKEARAHAATSWKVAPSSIRFDAAGEWDGEAGPESELDGVDVHIARHSISLTAEAVSNALTFWPNR